MADMAFPRDQKPFADTILPINVCMIPITEHIYIIQFARVVSDAAMLPVKSSPHV